MSVSVASRSSKSLLPRVAPSSASGSPQVDYDELLAAVGTNTGSSSDHGYVFGYALAADLLFHVLSRARSSSALDSERVAALYIDALVYPLTFCIRHFVELALKATMREAHALRGTVVDVPAEHGLKELWQDFKGACSLDRRLRPLSKGLAGDIRRLSRLDPTGQIFRYKHDVAGRLHLKHVDIIRITELESLFQRTRQRLDGLSHELEGLKFEYSAGTYTATLSRADLYAIADAWKKAFRAKPGWFGRFSARVKQQYRLTNSQLPEVWKIIEMRPFLSIRTGQELPLAEVSIATMGRLWLALGGIKSGFDLLTKKEWAGLSGVCAVMAATGYPEDYPVEVGKFLRNRSLLLRSDIARTIAVRPDKFALALERLGQPTLLAALWESWPD